MKALKITLLTFATIAVVSCQKTSENNPATTTNPTGTEMAENANNAATTTPVTPAVDPATAPVITFASDIIDFGDVKADEKVERTVEFTNTGKSPLVISNAKGSCGCTVPEWSKEAIAPGQKGSMKVAFTAPKTNGKQTKTVTLTTNTATGNEKFSITANVTGGTERQVTPAPQQGNTQLPAPKLEQVN